MKSGIRPLLAALFALALVGVAACGSTPATSKSGPSPANNSTPSAAGGSTGGGQLDGAVPMPTGFPADFPIYAGARLTIDSSVPSGSKSTWIMRWQTLDSFDKVSAYYKAQLITGDFKLTYNNNSAGKWGAFFTRNSDANFGGTISVDSTLNPGVTVIDVAMYG
jgi:hypothetical protein